MTTAIRTLSLSFAAILAGCAPLPGAVAQPVDAPMAQLTYADRVALAEAAQLVVRARIAKQIEVEPERAPGLQPGMSRLYIEAETLGLIAGNVPVGESLRYLVDVPLNERGKAPKLKNAEVLLFARTVPNRPGEIQLLGDGAQMFWSQPLEDSFRPVLTDLVAPDSPPIVTGIRDALSVPGNLVGESETQLFLETENDGPVSVTVVRRPNMAPVWGVSWTDIVDQSATAPLPNTLEWYRLACSLPATLPGEANLARDPAARSQTVEDYRYIVAQLGPCERTLGPEFDRG